MANTEFDFENGFKPYDKVLVRYNDESMWYATLFSHYTNDYKDYGYPYTAINGSVYMYCIPFNDETSYLNGTKDTPIPYYNEELAH